MSTKRAPERKLWVVDLENLVGCSPLKASPQNYADAIAALVDAVPFRPDDLMIVATNPGLAYIAHEVAPAAGLRTRGGPHGAELRLVEELSDTRHLARRFSHVVIASGDKHFVDTVCALNQAGLHTVVVSVYGQLAERLRLAARTVVWLPPSNHSGEAA
jgi:hypothetical protein